MVAAPREDEGGPVLELGLLRCGVGLKSVEGWEVVDLGELELRVGWCGV